MPNIDDMKLPLTPQIPQPTCTRLATEPGGNHADETRPVIEGDVIRKVRDYTVHCINGEDYLSTSTVLQIMRWGDLSHVEPFALEYGRLRGNYIDQACRCADAGCLGEIDPKLAGYLAGWERFKRDEPWTTTATERLVINSWAGTFGYQDRLGGYGRHANVVLDLKTSDYIGTGFRFQLASYLEGPDQMAADIQLGKDGSYTIHWLKDPSEWRTRWARLAREAHDYIQEEEAREQFYQERRRASRRKDSRATPGVP